MEKTILIQGAMKVELNYIKSKLNNIEEIEIDGYNFIIGKIDNNKIVLSETKIGTVNSALATYIGIKKIMPICIINQGVAGGTARNIHKNDLIIGNACINTNTYKTAYKKEGEGSNPFEWEITKFTSDDEIEENNNIIKTDDELLKIAENIKNTYKSGNVHVGILGSGDMWNNEIDRILWFNENFNTISADMESIGAYTIASKYKTSIIGIRVISDNIMLKEDYERNVANGAQEFAYELAKEILYKYGKE